MEDITFFTINEEVFGPMFCEHKNCNIETPHIYMSQYEYNLAKSQKDIASTNFIFKNKIGKALCDDHKPEELKYPEFDPNPNNRY